MAVTTARNSEGPGYVEVEQAIVRQASAGMELRSFLSCISLFDRNDVLVAAYHVQT